MLLEHTYHMQSLREAEKALSIQMIEGGMVKEISDVQAAQR